MAKLDELLNDVKAAIAPFWKRREEAGLRHTTTNRDDVLAAFEVFFGALKGGSSFDDAAKELYGALGGINEANDNRLLETDERELLVPFVIEAAKAVGINPAEHGGEPGSQFRDF